MLLEKSCTSSYALRIGRLAYRHIIIDLINQFLSLDTKTLSSSKADSDWKRNYIHLFTHHLIAMKLRNGKEYEYRRYRLLTWMCILSCTTDQQPDFCVPTHAHAICKSEFLRRNFKYRYSRLLRNRIPMRERVFTQIQLPADLIHYYCHLHRGPWDLDVILSKPFTIYDVYRY